MAKPEKKVTIHDIAAKTGYSIATVSRVINGTNTYYSEKTKEIIEAAIKELRYTPNIQARGLKKRKTYSFAYLVPQIDDYYASIFNHMQEAADNQGYSVVLFSSNYKGSLELKHIQNIRERQFDVIIISTGLLNADLNQRIDKVFPTQPVILIEGSKKRRGITNISLNVEDLCCQAVEYLFSRGHRKIAYLSAPCRFDSLVERYNGYCKAFQHHHIPIDRNLVFFKKELEQSNIADCCLLMKEILANKQFSAIIVMSDWAAASAIRAAKELHIAVPRDLSIIGFDNLPFTEVTDPRLTSISQANTHVGTLSVQLAIDIVQHRAVQSLRLDGEIVYRDSVQSVGDDIGLNCQCSSNRLFL